MNPLKSRQSFLAALTISASVALPGLAPELFAAEETPPGRLERLIPDDVIAYARFVGLTERIDQFLDSGFKGRTASSQLFDELLEDGQLRRGVDRLRETEEATGLDVAKLLRQVFSREVATGFFLDFSGPQGLLLARLESGQEARNLLERLRVGAASATGKPARGTLSKYEGETIETFDSIAFAVIGDVLAVASQTGVLESVIDLAAGRSERSVFRSKTYASAVKDAHAPLQLVLRPNFLPEVRLPAKLDSVHSLLFGGWLTAIHTSELLVVDLDLSGTGLVLRAASLVGTPGPDARFEPWFPRGGRGTLVMTPGLERELATVEVHRDLAAWWSRRKDFVEAGALQKMEAFAQYMSVVFGGASFERDVLSEIGSPITLVFRRQRRSGAEPEPALPEVAAIVPLRDSTTFGQALLAALQRLVGIVRVDQLRRGKEHGVELNLKTKEAGGRVLHVVELNRRGEAEIPGLIENVSPCLAILDNHAILSSTAALAERLIDGPQGASVHAKPSEDRAGEVLSLDCTELRRVLERSPEGWREGAGARTLELVLELFRVLRLTSVRDGNLVRLSLELAL